MQKTYNSVADCPSWNTSFWNASPDADWTQRTSNSESNSTGQDDVAGVHQPDSVQLVLKADGPYAKYKDNKNNNYRQNIQFRWDENHFHSTLKADDQDGLVLLFQAKAKQSIIVALSTQPKYVSDEYMYEILLGGMNNTTTIVRKRRTRKLSNGDKSNKGRKKIVKEEISVSIPSRVCRDDAWVSYWICLSNDKVYVGVGNVPGKECFGVLDGPDIQTANDKASEISSEQKGEETTDEQDEQRQVGDEKELDKEDSKDAIDAQKESQSIIQYAGIGNASKSANVAHVRNILLTNMPSFLAKRLAELPAQENLPIVVLPRDTPDSNELLQLMQEYRGECQSRKARALKYGTEYKETPPEEFLPWTKAKRLRENPEKGFVTGLDMMDPEEVAKREARKARFGVASEEANGASAGEVNQEMSEDQQLENTSNASAGDLPVEQAWDKEDMLKSLRRDPPKYLWKDATKEIVEDIMKEEYDAFAMERPSLTTLVTEKIHLSAIDWAAFKQIRNKDIMSYFSLYGPSYVEWLGDVSCNVCFEDKHTAARALLNLSNEIPTPIPEAMLQKAENAEATMSDLGKMTWRFCKRAIKKIANDRFGRRGTTARVLMRVATTEDTLLDRPNSWPAPPGGFSTKKILGPNSDYSAKEQKQKRGAQNQHRQNGNGGKSKNKRQRLASSKPASGRRMSAEDLMDRELSVGRAGFSLEDMEKERAKKKQKVEES